MAGLVFSAAVFVKFMPSVLSGSHILTSIVSPSMPFEFEEIQGDLFVDPDPTDALAHCVSEDLDMSKGT